MIIKELSKVRYFSGIRVVGKGSWKGQLEKTRGWKVRHVIWTNEVGKFGLTLESSSWSWKVSNEVENFSLNLERINEVGKLPFFPTSEEFVLFNFAWFFPNPLGSFQLERTLSNFRLSNLKFSNLKLSNFSFFSTTLSNYTYLNFSNEWPPIWTGFQFKMNL